MKHLYRQKCNRGNVIIMSYDEDPNIDPLENLKNTLNKLGYRLANDEEQHQKLLVVDAFIHVVPLHWDSPKSFE